MKKLLILPLIVSLVACAGSQHLTDPVAAQAAIKCETDKFSKITKCTSPTITTDIDGRDETSWHWMFPITYTKFRLFDNNGTSTFDIYTAITSNDWLFPNRVVDSDGKALQMDKIDSNIDSCVGGCKTQEHLSIIVSRAYVTQHVKEGISMKVYGARGEAIINMPAAYVQGFDSYLRSKGL
jgi:hypothetical protein